MNLEPDERVLRLERLHPGIFALPAFMVVVPLILYLGMYFLFTHLAKALGQQPFRLLAIFGLLLPLLPGLITLPIVWLAYLRSEITLTNKRLCFRTGIIMRISGELPLENVEGIFLVEPLLGQLFGYGSVAVTSIGGAQFPLNYIGKPQILHAILQKAVAVSKNGSMASSNPAASPKDDSRFMPKV